jgi:hypothetical protein
MKDRTYAQNITSYLEGGEETLRALWQELSETHPAIYQVLASGQQLPWQNAGFLLTFFSLQTSADREQLTNSDFFNLLSGRQYNDFLKRIPFYFRNYAFKVWEDIPPLTRELSDIAFRHADHLPNMKTFRDGAFFAHYLLRETRLRKAHLQDLTSEPKLIEGVMPLNWHKEALLIEAMLTSEVKLQLFASWSNDEPWYVTVQSHEKYIDEDGFVFIPRFDEEILSGVNDLPAAREAFAARFSIG